MIGQFFQAATLRVGLNILVKGIYLFGIERAVQNLLPEGDYGLYFSLLGLGMLLQVVADAGLQLYNSRILSGHRHLLAKYFPYFIGLKMSLGVLYFLFLLVAALILGYKAEFIPLLLIAGATQFTNSLVLYLRSILTGLGSYKLDSWFSIMDKSVMIIIIGGWLLITPQTLSVTGFASVQWFSWAASAGAVWMALPAKQISTRPRFNWPVYLSLLRGGAPYALAIFLATAYTRTDAIMIERLLVHGAEAVDHYAAGYRLLDAMNMFGWLLSGLLVPMYARMYKQAQDIRPLLRFSLSLLLSVSLVVALPIALYSQELVNMLYTFANHSTGQILFWLSLCFVIQCLNYAYGSLLSGTGHIGGMNKIFALGIMLNIGGNLLILPNYGAVGAAMVTFTTQAFVALVQVYLTHRWLHIPYSTIQGWRLMLLMVLLLISAYALQETSLIWWIAGILLGAWGLLLSLLLGLTDPRKVYKFTH